MHGGVTHVYRIPGGSICVYGVYEITLTSYLVATSKEQHTSKATLNRRVVVRAAARNQSMWHRSEYRELTCAAVATRCLRAAPS